MLLKVHFNKFPLLEIEGTVLGKVTFTMPISTSFCELYKQINMHDSKRIFLIPLKELILKVTTAKQIW